MAPSLTITLRDRTFTADEPTDLEITTLASLFLPGNTDEERLESLQEAYESKNSNPFGFDLNDPSQQFKLTSILMGRLMNPLIKARVAHVLTAIFPEIPENWVNYRQLKLPGGETLEDFRLKLNAPELLQIITDVINLSAPAQKQPVVNGFAKPVKVKR